MKPKATKIRMTAAEIKEAIKRDKEWMDNIGPDDEIVVDKKILGGILLWNRQHEVSHIHTPRRAANTAAHTEPVARTQLVTNAA